MKSSFNVQEERLCKLADELLSKYYDHYEYQLDLTMIKNPMSLIHKSQMPTLVVVINECLKVFPDDWRWNHQINSAYFKDDPIKNPCTSAMLYFDLDFIMFKHLFVPYNQFTTYFGGTMLDYNITPTEIGNNIIEFVKNYKSIMN